MIELPDIGRGLPLNFGPPRLDSYSRFVARAKQILPLIAFGLLVLIVIWPRLDFRLDRFSVIPKLDPRLAHDLRMLNARYTGIDRENRPVRSYRRRRRAILERRQRPDRT